MTSSPASWTAGVHREVLPNGLTLLVQRDRSAPVAAVVTHVKAGFFDEPDRWAGISHVLEHMFFKGTPTRGPGQIARETKAAGGYLNAGTSYDHTTYYVALPADRLRDAIAIQSDALMHAAIDAGELARELQVIIQEAKRKLDNPGAVTAETLHEVMYDHHRIRRWRIGYEKDLAGFTRADVHDYYASRYVPERTIVALVGDADEAEMLAQGRAAVMRELQREGQTQANMDELAGKMGFRDADALYLAAARGEVGPRAIHVALKGVEELPPEPEIQTRKSKAGDSQVLVVGVGKLLTQLGRCCKPVPPDAIAGFVTRGKGVSVHRVECTNFRNMAARNPERVIAADWGTAVQGVYAVDIAVEANDRQGLLRDISDVLSKERINVTAVRTQSRAGMAYMGFTVELGGIEQLARALGLLRDVAGVVSARRA